MKARSGRSDRNLDDIWVLLQILGLTHVEQVWSICDEVWGEGVVREDVRLLVSTGFGVVVNRTTSALSKWRLCALLETPTKHVSVVGLLGVLGGKALVAGLLRRAPDGLEPGGQDGEEQR